MADSNGFRTGERESVGMDYSFKKCRHERKVRGQWKAGREGGLFSFIFSMKEN